MGHLAIHWYDIVVPLVLLALLIGGLVILGLSIGAGYARIRRRTEQRPEQP